MSSRSAPGGGRGGQTRLALYLSLLWIASGADHSSERPASFWAALLGLPDPDGAGSRAIRSSWQELAARDLVTITPGEHEGAVPIVRLLREDGSGAPYTIPEGRGGDTYRRIPEAAWQYLFPDSGLTGPGLAMYLIALRTAGQAGSTTGLTFPRAHFKKEYGLGESTRKSGLSNLVNLGVLDVHRQRADDFGEVGRRTRLRNIYDLLDVYASPPQPASRVPLSTPPPVAADDEQTRSTQPGDGPAFARPEGRPDFGRPEGFPPSLDPF